MQFVDTHCHIQEAMYGSGATFVRDMWHKDTSLSVPKIIADATIVGVSQMIAVGNTLEDSQLAIELAAKQPSVWASVGIHPHEAKDYVNDASNLETLKQLAHKPKVIAVGECGLDYHYLHSPKTDQKKLLGWHIETALAANLPLIFHIREAFDDFWPIFDNYTGIRAVVHSFSASQKELDEILRRDLYIGLNGIVTFTKNEAQLAAAREVPLQKLLLETDAPFLTPTPYRGTINTPKHVRTVAEFLGQLMGESLEAVAEATTQNAIQLFGLRN